MNQKETELFKLTEDMQTLVHNVSSRLGFLYDLSVGKYQTENKFNKFFFFFFYNNNQITIELNFLDTIETIYDMCRFDKSWNLNDRSPWCAAFTRSELRTLEYLEDIQAYYDSGYGDDLNLRLGCTTVKDMLEGFR